MLTGDRRWVSSGRRGGMTVIGKVAVPKPINLPSQRLENHGLDPNVEIVPKGTLGWGNKSSPSASNPWGSSTLSPNADGGGSSPSFLSGRPSSSGSGTRPSTADSDRAHEPTNNARGHNSRPSSASGLVTSNQTTLSSLRPHSAETRPGSSHLSRFAESGSENSGAWGATGTAKKLGVTSYKNDGFSLASGDFPTLGSENDYTGKNIDAKDRTSHDGPVLSSGGVAHAKESESSVNTDVKSGIADSWKKENPTSGECAVRPSGEKWHADPQPYSHNNIRPQHYEAWRGPPVNNPSGGVWYRGPPGVPPYGNHVPPGCFPVESFPYFYPQMPGTALASPQPVPSPMVGPGPRVPHLKNGDMYRPHIPDSYIRPGMPIRPGFNPGPMPYDGYYGPPTGYHNSNGRDIPFMGMAGGPPPVYDRFSGQTGPDPGNSNARPGGYGSTGKAFVSEQEDPGHLNVSRGPYKVLLKQHNGLNGKDDAKEETVTNIVTCNEKDHKPRTVHENEWGADHVDEGINPRTVGEEACDQIPDGRGGHFFVHAKVNSLEDIGKWGNRKAIDDISVKTSEHATSFTESQQPLVSSPKGSSLIQKIECLNAKARDARADVSSVSSKHEYRNTIQVKVNHSTNVSDSGSVYQERNHSRQISTPPSRDVVFATGDDKNESTNAGGVVTSRRSHGRQGRADHRGKGRISTQEDNGWQKKSPFMDSPNKVLPAQAGTSNVSVLDHHTTMEAPEKSGTHPKMRDKREVGGPMFDPNDPQCATIKELAQQRLKQRQKEEEERISRQKANALAKLEQLNRRTQAVERSSNKSGPIKNIEEESQVLVGSMIVTTKSERSRLDSHPKFVAQISESKTLKVENSSLSSSEPPVEMADCATKQPVVVNDMSVPPQHDTRITDACRNASQVNGSSMPEQKHVGFKQKQRMSLEKSAAEKLSSIGTPEALKGCEDVVVNTTESPELANNGNGSNINVESMKQRKKNRGAKNKQKVEVVSYTSLPASKPEEANPPANISSKKDQADESELSLISLNLALASKDANHSSLQHSSFPKEESHGANKPSKSQHSRRVQRNLQNNRVTEKFHCGDAVVWAPVRSYNKTEVADEASNKTVVEAITPMKSETVQNNNAKNKRAELEIYVPKPAAKELAQAGNTQQLVESGASGSLGTVSRQPADYVTGKVGIAMESRNEDGRHNKQGKAHGSWRQRGASGSISNQELKDGLSYTSNLNRNLQKSDEHEQQNTYLSLEKGQLKFYGLGNGADVLNIPANPDSVPVVKDQGVTGRGKRLSFRGHKSTGNSHGNDQKKINAGDTHKSCAQSLAPQMSQTEPTALKENCVIEEHSATHWQPKSPAFSVANQHSNKLDGSLNCNSEVSRGKRKEPISHSLMPLQSHTETGENMKQPHHDHITGKSHVEVVSVGHGDTKMDKEFASRKAEPASDSMDIRHEHHSPSGASKNGNHNSCFGRGNYSHGDWSSSRQDIRQHNQPANRERQRHNSQYEYQPVGSYNNSSKSSNIERPSDGSHNIGARFKGQGYSRRGGGNSYGRQTDSARVDAGHD